MRIKYFVLFFVLVTAHFFLPRLTRADPFVFMSSDGTDIVSYSEEEITRYRAYYGLDKPLWKQYLNYLSGIACGNLGYSIYFKDKVVNLIFKRLIWTAGIVCASLIFGLLFGLCSGSVSALYSGKKLDGFLYHSMTALSEIPSFLTANLILMFFYYPMEGSADIGRNESVFTITVFAACYCGYFKTRRAACPDLIVYKNSRFLFYRAKRNAAAAAKKICGNGRSEIFTFFLYFTQALSAECIKSHYDKISIEPSNIV